MIELSAWGTSVFSDDLSLDIRKEYSILLSIGKSGEEAEKMLIDYYSSILNCDEPDEDVFWFALALCEWKKGRLSLNVKEKALSALENGRDLNRWKFKGNENNYEKRKRVLKELREIILSPMPIAKKIKKPTVHHCPWRVGSLLAYRIVSNKKCLENHPCYMKYVLLRVVRIDKHPISKLFDTGYYDETMMVGLYNWIGRKIPDSNIVHSLEYILLEDCAFEKPTNSFDESLLHCLPEESRKVVNTAIGSFFKRTSEKCVWLDWRSSKDEQGDITFLDCDVNFSNDIPEFFRPVPNAHTFTHFWPFDISLSKIFGPYLANQPNLDSIVI